MGDQRYLFLIEKSRRMILSDIKIWVRAPEFDVDNYSNRIIKLINAENIYVINSEKFKTNVELKEIIDTVVDWKNQPQIVLAVHKGAIEDKENLDLKQFQKDYKISQLYGYSIGNGLIGLYKESLKENLKIPQVAGKDNDEIGINDIFKNSDLYPRLPELFDKLEETVEKEKISLNEDSMSLYISVLKLILKTRGNWGDNRISEGLIKFIEDIVEGVDSDCLPKDKMTELKATINGLKGPVDIPDDIKSLIDSCDTIIAAWNSGNNNRPGKEIRG